MSRATSSLPTSSAATVIPVGAETAPCLSVAANACRAERDEDPIARGSQGPGHATRLVLSLYGVTQGGASDARVEGTLRY